MKSGRKIGMGGPSIGIQERIAADRVLKSGALAQGAQVKEFEQAFGRMIGSDVSCLALNSGTSALHLAALSLGLGPGDEVIVPAFTFAASANAIALTGAEVRFADVSIDTFNLDCESAKKLLNPRTRAVMFVHLYGNPAGIAEAANFAKENNLFLIEDAAQAHGAIFDNVSVGAWGDVAAFSFYPTKNMTTGEGGMVVSKNLDLLSTVELLRNQGMRIRYENELVGFNNRLTEYAASIGLVQLKKLEHLNGFRLQTAARYSSALETNKEVVAPQFTKDAKHVFHQYTVRVKGDQRETIASKLYQKGIATAVYYPKPLPHLKPYLDSKDGNSVPASVELCKTVLSLPINPSIGKRAVRRIASALRDL
jgi:perosamine synthetase